MLRLSVENDAPARVYRRHLASSWIMRAIKCGTSPGGSRQGTTCRRVRAPHHLRALPRGEAGKVALALAGQPRALLALPAGELVVLLPLPPRRAEPERRQRRSRKRH